MLELSTAHITEQTAEWIDDNLVFQNTNILGTDMNIIAYQKGDYGWFIPLGQDFDLVPADLKQVIEKAKQLKCDWIMLDRDAETVDGLRTYDW